MVYRQIHYDNGYRLFFTLLSDFLMRDEVNQVLTSMTWQAQIHVGF